MSISWLHRLIENPPPVSDEAFARVEREFGISLPADYRAIVREHQGGMPLPNGVEHPDASTAIEYLYHFEENPRWQNFIDAYYPIGDSLPNGVIPFAGGLGGDYFCFDFRKKPNNPTVVVYLHDDPGAGVITIAKSFTELLESLVD